MGSRNVILCKEQNGYGRCIFVDASFVQSEQLVVGHIPGVGGETASGSVVDALLDHWHNADLRQTGHPTGNTLQD